MSQGSPNAYLAQIADYARETAAAQQQAELERAREMERIRGIKFGELFIPVTNTPTSFVIPSGDGPAAGYAWSLKLASFALTGADSVSVWKGDVQSGAAGTPPVAGRLLGYGNQPAGAALQNLVVITWSSDQGIVKSGQPLFFTTSGAFRFNSIYLTYQQVPEEQLGKI